MSTRNPEPTYRKLRKISFLEEKENPVGSRNSLSNPYFKQGSKVYLPVLYQDQNQRFERKSAAGGRIMKEIKHLVPENWRLILGLNCPLDLSRFFESLQRIGEM